MYIAHPTHGAGTRPNSTQPPTAARKTTLNAGQCVHQPRGGRGRNRQAPPPQKKETTERGGGGGAKTAHSHQTARQHHQRRPTPPPPKAPKTGLPKRHRGTTQPKPATPSQQQRPTGSTETGKCRHTPRKKKRASSPAQKKLDGGTGTRRPGTGTPSNKHHKKKQKRKKHTPTTQPRRAGHSRDTGPPRTPTPHAGTRNGGGQAGRARNHTCPIRRPKPNPNDEHHKQPTLEGQHHKPCPNTPTQDPSQDWLG